jgi:protein ImuA
VKALAPFSAALSSLVEGDGSTGFALWRAHQLGRTAAEARTTGFDAFDAVLPGRGWPVQALSELLLPHPGIGELRLLAPALAAAQAGGGGLMWFEPPAAPCAWALSALGIDMRQLVVVRARQGWLPKKNNNKGHGPGPGSEPTADTLWALEHALKSGHLGAVVAWLPARLPADALRRLQLAAQAHGGPAFLLRPAAARQTPSAAPLRLVLSSAGPDRLGVAVLKRRGPPLAEPLVLELPAVLSPTALARARAGRAAALAASTGLPSSTPSA